MSYSKSDVETRRGVPAVNVKDYGSGPYDAAREVERKLEATGIEGKDAERIAEQAVQYAVESAREMFWNADAPEMARARFGSVKVYSEGRCGGWLTVHGLSDVESWDAVELRRWQGFERDIRRECDWRMSKAVLLEDIEANRWAEDGAEQFNFYERADGSSVCIAEANRAAAEARRAVLEGTA